MKEVVTTALLTEYPDDRNIIESNEFSENSNPTEDSEMEEQENSPSADEEDEYSEPQQSIDDNLPQSEDEESQVPSADGEENEESNDELSEDGPESETAIGQTTAIDDEATDEVNGFRSCMRYCLHITKYYATKWFIKCGYSKYCWARKAGYKAYKCVYRCRHRIDEIDTNEEQTAVEPENSFIAAGSDEEAENELVEPENARVVVRRRVPKFLRCIYYCLKMSPFRLYRMYKICHMRSRCWLKNFGRRYYHCARACKLRHADEDSLEIDENLPANDENLPADLVVEDENDDNEPVQAQQTPTDSTEDSMVEETATENSVDLKTDRRVIRAGSGRYVSCVYVCTSSFPIMKWYRRCHKNPVCWKSLGVTRARKCVNWCARMPKQDAEETAEENNSLDEVADEISDDNTEMEPKEESNEGMDRRRCRRHRSRYVRCMYFCVRPYYAILKWYSKCHKRASCWRSIGGYRTYRCAKWCYRFPCNEEMVENVEDGVAEDETVPQATADEVLETEITEPNDAEPIDATDNAPNQLENLEEPQSTEEDTVPETLVDG